MEQPLEFKGYLLFMLMAGCAFVFVMLALYMVAILEIASFVFSILSMGAGIG